MINQRRLRLNRLVQKSLKRKVVQRRLIRYGLVAANALVLTIVVVFVAVSSHTDQRAVGVLADASTTAAKPVDGLTAYDIAANVARIANLPESTPIANQAQSAHVAVAVSASDASIVPKPQIVATALKSREDIKVYYAQAGDTVSSIAQRFGVTSDSIKWSNNLQSDTVALGNKLIIPPINGIVYTVKSSDTIQSLATTYKANADQIIAANDAELSGIYPGEQVLIPNGQLQTSKGGGIFFASARSFTPAYGSNGYDFGYCTYYAAARSGAPGNWGNANTWAYYAALSGWTVSSVPRVGAIAQTSAGYLGHVAIVEAVSGDGSQIKYSDMNGISGWGRVGYSDWVPVSHFQHYIYR